MRRRTLLTVGNEGIKASEAVAGDICLCNKTTEKLLILKYVDFNIETYPSTNYSPVGVVVIPGSHDVYGDGSCSLVSLREMSMSKPTTGVSSLTTVLYAPDTDITTLKNYDCIPYVCYITDYTNIVIHETVQGLSYSSACFPSDSATSVDNPYDTDTKYSTNNEGSFFAASPYNEDDTRNTEYYKTSSPSSTGNALSDFDGRGNTDKILTVRGEKDYSSWLPSAYTDYPAASCCDMYCPLGTNQGDWYLPAIGELGYLGTKLKTINNSIQSLRTGYGSSYAYKLSVSNSARYYSSTERQSNMSWFLGTDGASVAYTSKSSYNYCRAFLMVK